MASKSGYFIGIDVGTQSVRAGLVTPYGTVVTTATQPIKTWNPKPNVYEQSSENIWALCVNVIKEITKGVDPAAILGIGFDATCSLVVVDKEHKPLSVSQSGNPEQNIILWMDHRAFNEAAMINKQTHKVLKYVGGKISPEMEPPKLLWLKKNMRKMWKKVGYFFDLPDFLTWKATGCLQRSLCSLVCKWTYIAGVEDLEGWQDDFWNSIGLEDFVKENYEKIGTNVSAPGEPCGNGLSATAAEEMGLLTGTPVSTSIIDAHAGGIGVLLCNNGSVIDIEERMALICGTSTCHMKVNRNAIFTSGVWGPYYSAMVPYYWCSEAGQSAAGALLDHVINSHPASASLKQQIKESKSGKHITDILNELAIKKTSEDFSLVSLLTKDYHVYPDFHGNRSPLASPELKGMVCGLSLSSDENDLIELYIATLQALACSTKHIISALEENGHVIKCLLLCGGLSKNLLYVQMHADITGLPVIVPYTPEPVLVGSAILAASASKYYSSVLTAMSSMSGKGSLIKPNFKLKKYHDKKYEVYMKLLKCQQEICEIMSSNCCELNPTDDYCCE